jgi:hypothetical protein
MFKSKEKKGSFEKKYDADQKKQSRSRFKQSVKAAVGKTFRGTRRAKLATYVGVLMFAGVGAYAVVQSFAATSVQAGWVTIAVRDAQTGQPIPNSWVGVSNYRSDPFSCYSGPDRNQKQMANGTTAFHCHVGSDNTEQFMFSFNAGQGYKPDLGGAAYVGYSQRTVNGNSNCKGSGSGCGPVTQHFDFYLYKVPAPTPPPAPAPLPAPGGVTPSAATLMNKSVYRMVRPSTGTYFYTTDVNEWNNGGDHGFRKEGVVFSAANQPASSLKAVYRLVRPSTGTYLYTTDTKEWNNSGKFGFKQEGIAFYVSDKAAGGLKGVYRLVRPTTGTYLYTTDVNEWNNADKQGFRKEGLAFYAR